MKILVAYRGIPQSPGWATGDFVVAALRRMGHEAVPYGNYYQSSSWISNRAIYPRDSFDLLLYMEMNDGDRQYSELAGIKAKKRAAWLFDVSYYPDNLTSLSKRLGFGFDFYFIANPLYLDKFENSYYLPYAADREKHYRKSPVKKKIDFGLVGSVRQDRRDLAKNLSNYGINLNLIGDVFREEYIDVLSQCRFIVNQNPEDGAGLLNMRYFESQMAGAIVFSEQRDVSVNAEARTPGVIPYSSLLDIKPPDFLSGETNFIKNMQDYMIDHHTYENRCEKIIQTIWPE